MNRLQAESEIVQQISRFAYAQDNLDLGPLTSLCCTTGNITMDASSHLPDHPPQLMTPAELALTTEAVIGGFTATQHFLGNHFFRWPSREGVADKVSVTSSVIAYHCIQASSDGERGGKVESVTARAYWHSELEREADGVWRFRGFRVERGVPLENPRLYGRAKERAAAGLGRKANMG